MDEPVPCCSVDEPHGTSELSYDEFALLDVNCEEHGLPWRGAPSVCRMSIHLSDGRLLSALRWGDGSPELVLLHGGAQNAHTWDTVALALGRPLLALDLPSQGHSDAARDGVHDPASLAADVAEAIGKAAPSAELLCGLSLGGLVLISLTAAQPQLVRRLVLVDVTPGITTKKARADSEAAPSGVKLFESFEALLAHMRARHPSRSEAALRRDCLHDAVRTGDGSWTWRWCRHPRRHPQRSAFAHLWHQLGCVAVPTMLVRGMRPSSLVDDADESELRKRLPEARVERLAEAGHGVPRDQPLALAALLESFLGT